MTPDDISTLTLAEIEAIAARLGAAGQTIRDAMALLTPRALAPQQANLQLQPLPSGFNGEPLPPHLAAKKAEREKFLKDLRNSPERQDKLKQFAHDGAEDEELMEDA